MNIDEQFIFSFVICMCLMLVAISTVYDVTKRRCSRQTRKCFTAFSLHSNYKNLMNISKSDSVVRCIDGLKILSAIWIMIWHRRMNFRFHEPNLFATTWDSFVFRFSERFSFGIDSFFICSAITVTLSILRSFEV